MFGAALRFFPGQRARISIGKAFNTPANTRLAPNVARRVERMSDTQPVSGEFLPADEISETLMPIPERLMCELHPYLQSVAQLPGGWATGKHKAEVPRSLGMVDCTIEGVIGQRVVLPSRLWMLLRSLDYLASLSGDVRGDAKAMLKA